MFAKHRSHYLFSSFANLATLCRLPCLCIHPHLLTSWALLTMALLKPKHMLHIRKLDSYMLISTTFDVMCLMNFHSIVHEGDCWAKILVLYILMLRKNGLWNCDRVWFLWTPSWTPLQDDGRSVHPKTCDRPCRSGLSSFLSFLFSFLFLHFPFSKGIFPSPLLSSSSSRSFGRCVLTRQRIRGRSKLRRLHGQGASRMYYPSMDPQRRGSAPDKRGSGADA